MGYSKLVKTLIATVIAAASSAAMADYSRLVVFGDSMSDTHRLYDYTTANWGESDPGLPNYDGRFSDGLVAVEYLAKSLDWYDIYLNSWIRHQESDVITAELLRGELLRRLGRFDEAKTHRSLRLRSARCESHTGSAHPCPARDRRHARISPDAAHRELHAGKLLDRHVETVRGVFHLGAELGELADHPGHAADPDRSE